MWHIWNMTQPKKEQNYGICRDMDGPRDSHMNEVD